MSNRDKRFSWYDIKDEPTRPWVEGSGEIRGDMREGINWDVVEVLGSNGAIVCDVLVHDAWSLTPEERARIDTILVAGR